VEVYGLKLNKLGTKKFYIIKLIEALFRGDSNKSTRAPTPPKPKMIVIVNYRAPFLPCFFYPFIISSLFFHIPPLFLIPFFISPPPPPVWHWQIFSPLHGGRRIFLYRDPCPLTGGTVYTNLQYFPQSISHRWHQILRREDGSLALQHSTTSSLKNFSKQHGTRPPTHVSVINGGITFKL
jgi:hypothetical protein